MADNIPVTAGTGTTVATDQLASGEHVQFIKVMDGTLDGTNKMAVSAAGAAKVDGSAVTQPVSGTVAVSGTVNVNPTGETAGVGVGAAADASTVNSVIGLLKKLIGLLPTALVGGRLDTNIGSIGGTVPSTAGKMDVKGADGDVFVRQATAANLNATVVQATGANLHTVIDSGTLAQLPAALGQGTMSQGVKVSLASDQSAIPEKFDTVAAATVTTSSATANGSIASIAVGGYGTAVVSDISDAGTQTTPEQVSFEGSADGGTNWFPIVAVRVDTLSMLQTLSVTTSPSAKALYQINCAGLTNVRLNQTVQLAGTGTVSWRLQASAAPSTLSAATDQRLMSGAAIDVSSGNKSNGTQRVTLATDQVQLTNALKVDGSAVTQPVSQATASSLNAQVVGNVAIDGVQSGNPVAVAGRASNALPTAMSADGDVVMPWLHRSGMAFVALAPHFGMLSDPYNLQSKTAQFTTAQTGTALWTPAAGKKVVITEVQIQVGGTVAGTVQLWFGGSADTTYTRGTDFAIFDGEFAPSATLKPGVIQHGCWVSPTADFLLRVTDSAAVNPITITVWGYEV